jgi:mono/diheme cytochrome c family protein
MRFTAPLVLSFFLVFASLSQDHPENAIVDLQMMNGKQIYTEFCSRCHGLDGKGLIPEDMIENMEAPPPDLTEPYFSSREKRADWQAVVRHGGPVRGLSASMPSWEGAISELQIAETVEHMKSFVDQSAYPQGELNFFRAHSVTKAFVEQEALVIPSYTWTMEPVKKYESTTVLYYANRFGNRFQYEIKIPVETSTSAGFTEAGFGDVEVGLKYAFFDQYTSLSIVSGGLEASLPTGDKDKGFGSGAVVLVPYLAAGQGVSDLLQLQASVKFETPLDSGLDAEMRYGVAAILVTGESKQGIFPGVELTGAKNLTSAEHRESIIPKVYWGITPRGHLALSIGFEIPLNSPEPYDGRIVAFLLWDFVDGGIWW